MKLLKSLTLTVAAFGVMTATAAELSPEKMKEKFNSIVPFSVKAVEKAPIKDFTQFITTEGIFYLSNDGEHLISGSIHKATRNLPNLTKERLGQVHKDSIEEMRDSFLTYKAENEKYEIVVFYDASCPYCRKLHHETPKLVEQGVTVHYAGWPRTGVRNPQNPMQFTQGYRDLENIWCADNPQQALDRSADGFSVTNASCDTRIEEHFKLGEQMGVRGTPAIFDVKGREVARGWAPASQLMNMIEALD